MRNSPTTIRNEVAAAADAVAAPTFPASADVQAIIALALSETLARRAQRLEYSAPSVDGGTHVETSRGAAGGDEYSRVGRNDPCPCGSGRKYKRCHGDPRNMP